jgi:hypothetical protein
MFSAKLDSGYQATRTGDLNLLRSQDRFHPLFLFILELSPIPLLKFGLSWSVDF